MEVCLADSSGLVENGFIILRGLEKGKYLVTTIARKEVVAVTDSLKGIELIMPINEFKRMKIERSMLR